jgi:putative transposase
MIHHCRSFVPGCTYFFTVALADRQASLLTDRSDALGAAFRRCRSLHPFETLAIAVLPEHLHCVWTLPDGDADFTIRWSLIRRAFTRRQYHEGPTPAGVRRGVWQSRFWKHAICDEVDLQRHVDYIHYNPVLHGLAPRSTDWPHSSFHRYVKRGWLSENWASDADADPCDFGE